MWQLYKYQAINKMVLSNLAHRKLWVSFPSVFNDPFEFRLQRTNDVRGLEELRKQNPHLGHLNDADLVKRAIEGYESHIRSWGVICFTEVPDSILMWSHYADLHRGICLGFCGREEAENPNDIALYQVVYEEEYPELDFSKIWYKDGLAKILWTKHVGWAHEQEWRLIHADVAANRLIDYPGRLNKIIFGLRTTQADRYLVKSILKAEEDVEYFEVVQDDRKYKLHIQPIQ